jgi:hypothetical protein
MWSESGFGRNQEGARALAGSAAGLQKPMKTLRPAGSGPSVFPSIAVSCLRMERPIATPTTPPDAVAKPKLAYSPGHGCIASSVNHLCDEKYFAFARCPRNSKTHNKYNA